MEITTDQLEDLANRLYDASGGYYGDLEVSGYDVATYCERMTDHALIAMLWADTRHVCPEAEEKGECACDVTLNTDSIPTENRDELFNQVESFVTYAWWYLNEDEISPDMAGHDFHLTRNHHGAGFWDRGYKYGTQLTELTHPYGDASIEFMTDEDGTVTGVYFMV